MARRGRDLELLVSRIEGAFLPPGAIVKSPDYVKDKVTGETREVDVAIYYQVGTVPILITVECRDHQDPQNDTWLEQLATKRLKIGAAKTIAVSSSDFTAPAIKDAQFQDIEIRRIEKITDEEIRKWFAVTSIHNFLFRSYLVGVDVLLHGEPPDTAELFDPQAAARLKQDSLYTPVIARKSDGKQFTVSDLIRRARYEKSEFFRDVPQDGSAVRKDLNFEFALGLAYFLPATVPNDLKKLTVTLDLSLEQVTGQFDKIVQYSNEMAHLAYVSECEFTILGNKLICSVIRKPESPDIVVRLGSRIMPVLDRKSI